MKNSVHYSVKKVIMYLFEDAAKTKHKELFEGCDSDKLNRFLTFVQSLNQEVLLYLVQISDQENMQIR